MIENVVNDSCQDIKPVVCSSLQIQMAVFE